MYKNSLFYLLGFAMFFTIAFGQRAIDLSKELEERVALEVVRLVERDARLQQLQMPEEGEVYSPFGADVEVQKRLKRIAAYDVGSTGVKFKLADVDPITLKIVNIIYTIKVHTKFEIKENDFLDRIAIMAGLKALVERYFPHYSEIEHYATATEGFRAAGELGLRLAQEITNVTGIGCKVVDQDYEGLLAYYGILAQEPTFDSSKDIVWDIGGGSSQLLANEKVDEEEKMRLFKMGVGGAKYLSFILKTYREYPFQYEFGLGNSPNPIALNITNKIIDDTKLLLAKEDSPFLPVLTSDDIDLIKSNTSIGRARKVFGIGHVHNFVAKTYVGNNIDIKKY